MSLIADLKARIEAYAQQVATIGAETAAKAREPEIKAAAKDEATKTLVPYVIGGGAVALAGVIFGVMAVVSATKKRTTALAGAHGRRTRRGR